MNSLKASFRLLLQLCLILFSQFTAAYQNPLVQGADPCVMKWMGKYYMYTTGNRLYESGNLVEWTYKGTFASSAPELWAPDIFYYNGTFYAYLSSSAFKCQIASSSSPEGPFVSITSDAGVDSIDFNAFMDDDGQLYMSYAGNGGIKYQTMSSPITIDGPVNQWLATAWVDGYEGVWTEAPFLQRLGGTYYLLISGGIQWYDPTYQVVVAKGQSITDIERVDDYPGVTFSYEGVEYTSYPMISRLDGPWYATGHPCMILGPNLKTYYVIYHAYNGTTRSIMVDEVYLDSSTGNLMTQAPTFTAQADPELPYWWDAFDREAIGSEWATDGVGAWTLQNQEFMRGDSRGEASWAHQIMATDTGDSFVAEFNVRLLDRGSTSSSSRCGVFVGYKSGLSGMYVFVDEINNRLSSYAVANGVDKGWVHSSPLPSGWDHRSWHTIRIDKKGMAFQVFIDDMMRISRDVWITGGKIGFVLEDSQADFGWTAFSNYTNDEVVCGLEPCPDAFDSGEAAYSSQDFHALAGMYLDWDTSDVDGTLSEMPNIYDSWEVAVFGSVLCGQTPHPMKQAACDAYTYNLALLPSDNSTVISVLNAAGGLPFAAATLAISKEWNAAWAMMGLTNIYQPVTVDTKSGNNEPFSPQGDLDGDGLTNQDEFDNVISVGGSMEDYVQAVDNFLLNGTNSLPGGGIIGLGVLLIALAFVGAFALRQKRQEQACPRG